MSFVLTFPWRRFVLAMRDRHRAYQNEIAIFVFGVTAKDFSHGMLLDREDRRSSLGAHVGTVGTCFSVPKGTDIPRLARRETRVIGRVFLHAAFDR